jgi:carbonic anhydrase/acetyltransferase-like protein (isoleucine patch superfamily)
VGFDDHHGPAGILARLCERGSAALRERFAAMADPGNGEGVAAVNDYAVVRGNTRIGANVLVAQRAYLEDAHLGDGANAQENCMLLRAHLSGQNVTAHGARVVDAALEEGVFVGFNALVRGTAGRGLKVGRGGIVLPHTLIDLKEPVEIPPNRLVWGHITAEADLKGCTLDLEDLEKARGDLTVGAMSFRGDGEAMVSDLRSRIHHILEENGAFFDGNGRIGHAQRDRTIAFNALRPYTDGDRAGLCPTVEVGP